MKSFLSLILFLPVFAAAGAPGQPVVVFQPSHQTDTGENYNEALTANAIAEYALSEPPHYNEYKVWSYNEKGLHHADTGTNTLIAHTAATENGKISGYTWELEQSNKLRPLVFIGIHNNSGTGRHALWGYIHDGDPMEAASRRLSNILIEEIARATTLENRGTHLDSSAGRNDYRCAATGRQAFYSIDENVNAAPFRVILEIGDIETSRYFLLDDGNRRAIGAAIKRGLERFLRSL